MFINKSIFFIISCVRKRPVRSYTYPYYDFTPGIKGIIVAVNKHDKTTKWVHENTLGTDNQLQCMKQRSHGLYLQI